MQCHIMNATVRNYMTLELINVKKMNVTFVCNCGNEQTYNIKKYSDPVDKYFDLTETIRDVDGTFDAKPTSQGTWLWCKICNEAIDIV